MAFIETEFPTSISFGSSGGPSYSTDVIEVDGGHEYRNARWPTGRHMYNALYGVKTQSDLDDLIEFFHAVQGKTHGFRWKDWLDYKSCQSMETISYDDQNIGTGDGSTKTFQLRKSYTQSTLTTYRNIKKPVSGTVRVGVNGVEQMSGWSVDTTTGIVTFTVAPTNTHEVVAGFEFRVPCRMGVDQLNITVSNKTKESGDDAFVGGSDIPVIELFIS